MAECKESFDTFWWVYSKCQCGSPNSQERNGNMRRWVVQLYIFRNMCMSKINIINNIILMEMNVVNIIQLCLSVIKCEIFFRGKGLVHCKHSGWMFFVCWFLGLMSDNAQLYCRRNVTKFLITRWRQKHDFRDMFYHPETEPLLSCRSHRFSEIWPHVLCYS